MKKEFIRCELTGNECFQHTGLQCRGESKNCAWKIYPEKEGETK